LHRLVVKIATYLTRRKIIRGDTTLPKNGKFKDYTRYAAECLNLIAEATDQEERSVRRDMATEWLNLATAIRRSRKSWQIVPLKSR
jgi:hypothetical protein